MNNKEYIKKGQEYLKGSKEYAYAFFILQMVLVLASIFLFFPNSKKRGSQERIPVCLFVIFP